jgi:hypothetical protein
MRVYLGLTSDVVSSRQPPPSPVSNKRGLWRRHGSHDDDDDDNVAEAAAAADDDDTMEILRCARPSVADVEAVFLGALMEPQLLFFSSLLL